MTPNHSNETHPDQPEAARLLYAGPEAFWFPVLEGQPGQDAPKTTAMSLDLSRETRPYSPADTLVYYDGPQVFWLPSPGDQPWLAIALPDEVGPWPFLVCELTETAANSLLTGASLRATVLGAQAHWLLRDYEEEVLQLEPLSTIPEDWLPGDVALSLLL